MTKYLLFDADSGDYLDTFDKPEDWGFVVKIIHSGDNVLVYRGNANHDWTSTLYNFSANLKCIMCPGTMLQISGSNHNQFRKKSYKCQTCDVEMDMHWDKYTMKNRVTESKCNGLLNTCDHDGPHNFWEGIYDDD